MGLPVIKIKELRTGITEASDIATSDVPEKYLVNEGDILFSWSGSLALVLWSGVQGLLNQHLFKVSSNEFPQWFCYFWVKYHLPYFIGVAEDKATTMGHIQRHHLSSALVTVPPKSKLDEYHESIEPLFSKMKYNSKQIRTLTQLRDTLLPKLMSGEVKVKY
jgi:type I restriction enzyme S subunit